MKTVLIAMHYQNEVLDRAARSRSGSPTTTQIVLR